MINGKVIGNAISTQLAKHDMKQKELAAALGIRNENVVSYYCSGSRIPTLDLLCKIADIFGVSLDYLIGRTKTESPNVDIQVACETTGLSETAVQAMRALKTGSAIQYSEFLVPAVSALFENMDGLSVLSALSEYLGLSPANTYQLVTKTSGGVEMTEKYDASYLLLKDMEEHLKAIRERTVKDENS